MRDTVWPALADPSRRRLLDELGGAERTVGELAARARLTQPSASKHLKVLREAGLVTVRQHGPQRRYAVDPAAFDELARAIEPYRRRWNAALDRLDDHLAEPSPDGPPRTPQE